MKKRIVIGIFIYKQCRCIVEHPFGTIKRVLGYSFFLRRQLDNVDAEASSMFIAYNIKHVFNEGIIK